MEMTKMNMNQLRSLAKERNLRGYSRLRKADLINFSRENEPSPPPAKDELPIEQPQKDKTNTLTKLQLKADFLSWQKPLASPLRVLADNFSLLPAPQRVLAAWFKIFN